MGKWLTCMSFDDCGEQDGKWARLTEGMSYRANDGAIYFVPMGFTTDFASIPRLLQTLVGSPTGGRYRRAAVLHDYLYKSGLVPRDRADEVFKEAMLSSGVSQWKAWQMWAGVRVGGASSYGSSVSLLLVACGTVSLP